MKLRTALLCFVSPLAIAACMTPADYEICTANCPDETTPVIVE